MDKKRVLVTGASRGIGRATALKLAEQGFFVSVHYRTGASQAEAVLEQIVAAGGRGDLVQFDIAQREQTRQTLEQIVERDGAYYAVVCNAGMHSDNAFPAMSDEQWDSVVHTLSLIHI